MELCGIASYEIQLMRVSGDLKERIGTAAYKSIVWPALRNLDAERSHELTIWLGKNRLTPVDRVPDDPILRTEVFGLTFANPLGLAAGCDKQVDFPCLDHCRYGQPIHNSRRPRQSMHSWRWGSAPSKLEASHRSLRRDHL